MSVILNEAGLDFFLRSESGPVGREVRDRAERILERASANASGSILGIDTGDLLAGLRSEARPTPDGIAYVVGTDAKHGGFNYPAYWDTFIGQTGRKPWLTRAVEEVFPD